MNGFDEWAKKIYSGPCLDGTPRHESLQYLAELKLAYEAGFSEASDRSATLPQRSMFDAGFARGYRSGMGEAAEIVKQKAEVVKDYTNEQAAHASLQSVYNSIMRKL